MKMKKMFCMMCAGVLSLSLVACGDKNSDEGQSDVSDKTEEKVFLDENQISDLYSSPKDFIGKYVTLSGKVFTTPETSGNNVALQMWQDSKNNDHNTIVIATKDMVGDIGEDDYIKVTGLVEDEFEGENMMGGTITAPQIRAEKIEKTSYQDVSSPTNKTIKVDQTQESNGVKIKISKIELADNETRVFLSVDNQSGAAYSFYTFNSKIIQGNKQYTEETNYEAGYDEIESDIPSGVKEEGVIAFKAIKDKDFKFTCEGQSENYELDGDNFTFEISVK